MVRPCWVGGEDDADAGRVFCDRNLCYVGVIIGPESGITGVDGFGDGPVVLDEAGWLW